MTDLFVINQPWWHFPIRAVAIYFAVMVLVRLSGKRAVGQFTPFDLILLILIGNAVQNGLNGGDNSLTGALLLVGCVIAINYAVAWVTSRSHTARRLIEGSPVVLARDGQILREVLRRELVSTEDFSEAMQAAGCNDIARVKLATLEPNGRIVLRYFDEPPPT